MWHSAVGFLAVAISVALIVRHFGAPRAVTVGFVITGLGVSLATLLLADANTVDPGVSRPPAYLAQTAPVSGRDVGDPGLWR